MPPSKPPTHWPNACGEVAVGAAGAAVVGVADAAGPADVVDRAVAVVVEVVADLDAAVGRHAGTALTEEVRPLAAHHRRCRRCRPPAAKSLGRDDAVARVLAVEAVRVRLAARRPPGRARR